MHMTFSSTNAIDQHHEEQVSFIEAPSGLSVQCPILIFFLHVQGLWLLSKLVLPIWPGPKRRWTKQRHQAVLP